MFVQCTLMTKLEPIKLDTEKEGYWFTGYKDMLFSTFISYFHICYFNYRSDISLSNPISSSPSYSGYWTN